MTTLQARPSAGILCTCVTPSLDKRRSLGLKGASKFRLFRGVNSGFSKMSVYPVPDTLGEN